MYTEVYGTIRSYAALRALNWIVIDIRHDVRSIIYIYIHIEKIAVDIARRGLAHARPDYCSVGTRERACEAAVGTGSCTWTCITRFLHCYYNNVHLSAIY